LQIVRDIRETYVAEGAGNRKVHIRHMARCSGDEPQNDEQENPKKIYINGEKRKQEERR
jgi:hypothetical protein